MAAASTYAAVAAVAVAAGSAYSSHQQSAAAAEDQKDAQKLSANEAKAQEAAKRRQQIREERVKRATIQQASQNTGVSASSGELGSQSVLGINAGTSFSNMSRSTNVSDQIGALNQSAAESQQKAQTIGAIGSFAGTVFGAAAPYAAKSVFGTADPKATGTTNSSKGIFD